MSNEETNTNTGDLSALPAVPCSHVFLKPETITEKLLREKRIDNDFDHKRALARISQLMDIEEENMNTKEMLELGKLVEIVEEFEDRTYGPFI